MNKYPSLRFKKEDGTDYPDWQIVKLGDVVEMKTGATPSTIKKEYWEGGVIHWASSGELNLRLIYDTEKKITDLGLKKSSTSLLPTGCVLIALAGQGRTRGTVAMNLIPLCTNQSIAAILPCNEIHNSFLYYNLFTRYKELRARSSGDSSRGGLSLTILKDLPIPLPHIHEQVRISQFFSFVDSTIDAHTTKIHLLQLFKKSMLQQMFAATGNPVLRFKKEDGTDYPDWQFVKLGDVVDYRKGGAGSKSDLSDDGNECILYGELYTKYKETISTVFSKTHADITTKSLAYDILIPTDGETAEDIPLSTSCILKDGVLLGGGHLTVLSPHINILNGIFMTYCIRRMYKRIVPLAQGATIVNLSWKNLQNIVVPLPHIEEQARIAQFFSFVDSTIDAHTTKIQQLQLFKKSMLQRMFI